MAPTEHLDQPDPADGAADQNTATKASLMTIPPELRLEIYTYYFKDFIFRIPAAADNQINDLQAPLLNTCQLIRNEALSLYKTNIEGGRNIIGRIFEAQTKMQNDTRLNRNGNFASPMLFSLARDTYIVAFREWAKSSTAFIEELRKIEESMRK